MKLADFNDLCLREWGEARGDVTGLSLTDESAEELRMTAPGYPLLANPVTRSQVKVAKGADTDTAEVRRYYAEPHPLGA